MTAKATSVNSTLIDNMNPMAPTVMMLVSAGYMMPGPRTIRTAVMSFEARDMRSPVLHRP